MTKAAPAITQAQQMITKGDLPGAEALLRKFVAISPRDAGGLHMLGTTLFLKGQWGPALAMAQRAHEAAPNEPNIIVLAAQCHAWGGQPLKAVELLRQAAPRHPHAPSLWDALGTVLLILNKPDEALPVLRRAAELNPTDPGVLGNLTACMIAMGRPGDALRAADQGLRHAPNFYALLSGACSAMNYVDGVTPASHLALHKRAGEAVEAQAARTRGAEAVITDTDPNRVLRVGFIGPDLRRHSVAYFLEPILRHADRSKLWIACYASNREDEVSAALKGASDRWLNIAAMSDAAAAQAIADDRIDILIDLAGFTIATRLGVLAHRPAPVRATFLGYPATTGSPSVQYRIVDATTDPAGAEAACAEQLARVDGGFLCYAPPAGAPEPAITPHDGVVFGSFNMPAKLSARALAAWSNILRAVPNSRLLLKGLMMHAPDCRGRVLKAFEQSGIDLSRIEIRSSTPSLEEHLASYSEMDIALDPMPYGGTTTTCEALWMGVPVVTLRGTTHTGRVGASLLSAVGLPELIADSDEAYAQLATRLAADREVIARYRSTLRARLAASPLCDGPGYAARFERTLRGMWAGALAAQAAV